MTETTFPRVEAPLTEVQWKSIGMGFGTGVIDQGGNPYNLVSLNNASNSATLAVDTITGFNHAVVSGFYHRQEAPIKVELPAVTKETTYYITLMYDPLSRETPVKIATLTALDKTGGKDYLVLWKVVRQANQLLTDSVRTKQRPILAPTIMLDTPENLPDVKSVLWGTRAYCQQTSQEYRASYTQWKPISPYTVPLMEMPGWNVNQITGGVSVMPTQGGLQCSTTFSIERASRTYTLGTTFDAQGSDFGTIIPSGYRPPMRVYFLTNSGDRFFEGRILTSGVLDMRSIGTSQTIATNNGFSISASWFIPKTY